MHRMTLAFTLALALASPALAQFTGTPAGCDSGSNGPTCCVPGKDGKDGRDGIDGTNGIDGRDGTNGRDGIDAPVAPRTFRPFDIGAHGVNFAVRAVVQDNGETYLLIYEPTIRAAALVDVSSGAAQVALNFTADVPPDVAGRVLTFDDVSVLGARAFVCWHRGAAWSHNWDEALPWVKLAWYEVNGVPLFRWR